MWVAGSTLVLHVVVMCVVRVVVWARGGRGGCWHVMCPVMGCPLVVVGAEARGPVRQQGVGAVEIGRCPPVVGRR